MQNRAILCHVDTQVRRSALNCLIPESRPAQAKAGMKAIGPTYLGIEGGLQGLVTSSRSLVAQRTIGAHITGVPVGPVSLSFSAGYVSDNDLGGGVYLASSLYFAF